MEMRIERDTLGEVKVPQNRFWGAQTQRSLENFKIGEEKMPRPLIYAFAELKKAAAIVNAGNEDLATEKKEAVVAACEQILTGQFDEHFPIVVWQTGSGTQSNMNMNEVIAYMANEQLQHTNIKVHPNDDVNRSQSSNDTFPTAMHIATVHETEKNLFPAIQTWIKTLTLLEDKFKDVMKVGRTHLQDATPLTFGQEVSAWKEMLKKSNKMIRESLEYVRELAIGGTAVGTGLNSPASFGEEMAKQLTIQTGRTFIHSNNFFHALTSHDQLVHFHGAVKALAADLFKIANDIRLLASGPRSGIAEITIPANEPGSSIMPGKVNPTQSEAMTMVASQIFGNDATISFAASQGHYQLNVFKPVIAYNVLQSIRLLTDGLVSFHDRCLVGIEVDRGKMTENVERSLMLVTALNSHIGYENAAKIAKKAFAEKSTLKEAALNLGLLTSTEFDTLVKPEEMIHPRK
ncbi:fumarate hydratase [Alkalihalobacillus alcalophilus ATCC 27647 = CGMCC 1.3604]|uniref:Fumarate hydratase class II n=1 Tax=Alkalihalobacillus alcalophilus ATCC 27647 = CGMCC 1.3604 TaxID=1218173 RepID=A0A094XDH4_ALKAL|nr:class II fumarate hydratase [Alkalihalobacillus alcalophilus]KGA96820.1 fumarate hydratase [Alkalihalobacillus alcalophilus ATCC 27647 = CGMCC 1.3604]MED1561209.1 class II fumarate hydratase [Alkalihalobacillus alcalophilus]THG88862.1 fumarate hydratase [Alkalihalobacillus alcalophilus ATCC 27647 = CGMCC 1.3604]